jgi:hypothetical protein
VVDFGPKWPSLEILNIPESFSQRRTSNAIYTPNARCAADAKLDMETCIRIIHDASAETAVMPLTGVESVTSVCNDAFGALGMADDPRLEQAFDLIRAVVADADRRAASKMVERITSAAGISHHDQPQLFPNPPSPDKRAPHGSAGVLIDRALAEAGDNGLTVAGIQAKAETDFERMVSTSAIRNWLREMERKKPPKYRQVGGVWFLASHGPTMKVVG